MLRFFVSGKQLHSWAIFSTHKYFHFSKTAKSNGAGYKNIRVNSVRNNSQSCAYVNKQILVAVSGMNGEKSG